MKRLLSYCLVSALMFSTPAIAQQAQVFGEYTVHYNALNTSQLTPQVAQTYGIQRSSSRAMLNITVLHNDQPVNAAVTAGGKNLTGQLREIDMRRVEEGGDAIYYIGEFRVNNLETFDFTVNVSPEGSGENFEVRFRQQFYTE